MATQPKNLPAKLRNYFAKPLRDYQPIYNLGERSIKRWVSDGRHATPPDLPPLDEPHKMAAWWRRVKPAQRPPENMQAMEREAQIPATGEKSENGEADPAGSASISSINLDEITLGADEEVRQIESLVAAHFQRLKEASESGNSDGVRRWTPIHRDACEQLRKTKTAVMQWKKQIGELLPRGPILAELSQMLEALRIARSNMARKVLAELGREAHGRKRRVLNLIEPDLAAAIDAVRKREDDLFQNIETLGSPEAAAEAFKLHAA